MRSTTKSISGAGLVAVEAYLAGLPEPDRSALEQLRTVIKAAAPSAEEYMTYGMPGFRHDGALVGYSAFKAHLSFFPMSPALMDALGGDLDGLRTSKGTIQFQHDSRCLTIWYARSSLHAWPRTRRGRQPGSLAADAARTHLDRRITDPIYRA